MSYYIFDTKTKTVQGWSNSATKPELPTGFDAVAGDSGADINTLYVTDAGAVATRTAVTTMPATGWVSVDGGDPVPIAQAPTTGDHVMVLVGAYRGTITLVSRDTAYAARWTAAKAYRASRIAAGCSTGLGVVQTDDTSVMRIVTAAGDAMNNQAKLPAWSIDWTMKDNTVKTHTAAQMIAMSASVTAYVKLCQFASQAIRTKLKAATTVAAVQAIDITAGYPA